MIDIEMSHRVDETTVMRFINASAIINEIPQEERLGHIAPGKHGEWFVGIGTLGQMLICYRSHENGRFHIQDENSTNLVALAQLDDRIVEFARWEEDCKKSGHSPDPQIVYPDIYQCGCHLHIDDYTLCICSKNVPLPFHLNDMQSGARGQICDECRNYRHNLLSYPEDD